ncbi:hypothetical protein, partial [uncultured Vibrio sp.]|uniref:hypothetical protein n=1 Tax=uncultured Vibrio sp. TaxID=114054 RepID=UPI0026286D82
GLGGGSRPELIHYYALSNGWGSIWQEYVDINHGSYRAVPIKTLYHAFALGHGYGHASGMTYGWSDYLGNTYMPDQGVNYYQSPSMKVPEIVIETTVDKSKKTIHLSFVKDGSSDARLNVKIAHDNDLSNEPLDFNVIKGSKRLNQLSLKFNSIPFSPVYVQVWDDNAEYISTVKLDVFDIVSNVIELTYETGGLKYYALNSNVTSENDDLYSLTVKCQRISADLATRDEYIALRNHLIANNQLDELLYDVYITGDSPANLSDQRYKLTLKPDYESEWINASTLIDIDKGFICVK